MQTGDVESAIAAGLATTSVFALPYFRMIILLLSNVCLLACSIPIPKVISELLCHYHYSKLTTKKNLRFAVLFSVGRECLKVT